MSLARALPPTSLAPWTEIVPTRGPVTVDILLTLPDDGYVYEVVEGVLIRMVSSGNRATRLAARLTARLLDYVEAQALGVVTAADGMYTFPGAETGHIPSAEPRAGVGTQIDIQAPAHSVGPHAEPMPGSVLMAWLIGSEWPRIASTLIRTEKSRRGPRVRDPPEL